MDIFKDGVLVEIKVRFWTGAKILTAQDLGLEKDTISNVYLLGKKMLVPKETIHKFRSIESKARFLVETNSFKFPISSARFVPKKKFLKILQTLQEYQEAYNKLIDNLIVDYDKLRKEMLPIYEEAAKAAYNRQTKIGVHEFSIEGKENEEEEFVTNFLDRIKSYYPSTTSLRNRFSLTWNIFEIALPKMRKVSEDKIAKENIAYDVYQKEAQEKIGSFINEVVTNLREQVVTLCDKIATNMKSGKIVKGPTINSLKKFIDDFSELNFVGDVSIEKQLLDLKNNFLEKHTSPEIIKSDDLQLELKRKLNLIVKEAGNVSDIDEVTGQYRRKIQWVD